MTYANEVGNFFSGPLVLNALALSLVFPRANAGPGQILYYYYDNMVPYEYFLLWREGGFCGYRWQQEIRQKV